MIRLEVKIFNMVLTEKQQRQPDYDQVKLMNMNFLQVKK